MAPSGTCPFCGGSPVKKRPWLAGTRIAAGAAGIGASLEAPDSREEYLQCRGCMIEYVDAERDIETILQGLRVERAVAFQIRSYYGEGGPTAADLLARHRTAIVRRAAGRRSILSVSVDRGELIACFLYNGVRTFGLLVKSGDGPDGASRYVFRWLSKA